MSKIFSIEQIRKADAFTIESTPVSSSALMERAATECVLWLKSRARKQQCFAIFAGPGNNGGDGLAIARLLINSGFLVRVFVLQTGRFSDDFSINLERLQPLTSIVFWEEKPLQWPVPEADCIIIDAIFGSGLSKPLQGLAREVVQWMNEQPQTKVAIDIPTGLFADKPLSNPEDTVVSADYTLSFQFIKPAFLMPENEFFVGDWHILDIGLSQEFIENEPTNYFTIDSTLIKSFWQKRSRFGHKGVFGHSLIVAGDSTKMGAGLLAAKSCLKSGAGLVTLHHPKNRGMALNAFVPEVMSSPDESEVFFSKVPPLQRFDSIAVGPGLGQAKETQKALKFLLQDAGKPLVIDADALNILAINPTWIPFIPVQSILTPHPGEFERLVGKSENSFDRLNKSKAFAEKFQVILVVKGAHTWVVTPAQQVFFNTTGNPGMATAGSGDVLTGIIASLVAQNYSPAQAALAGVWLHGLAGDLSAETCGFESLTATDIINHLGQAIKTIY